MEKVSPKHGTFRGSVQFCFSSLLQKQEGEEEKGGGKKEEEVVEVERGISTDNMQ